MIRDSPNSVGAEVEELAPTAVRVRNYLASLADTFSLPRRFVLASAQTERDFNPDDTHGLPQVSGVHIGRTLRDADGSPFEIEDDIKANWRANARAGVDRLARQYQVAQLENPFGSLEEWAQQAYSGLSAGNPFRDRYLTTLSGDLPAHPRDRVFLRNFRKAAREGRQEEKQPQAPTAQQSSAPQPGQNQAPDSTAKPSAPSGPEPLPGSLQRLIENPGNLFLRAPATSAQANAPTRSLGRVIDLVPSLSAVPSPRPSARPSLENVASLLASRQPTVGQSSGLPSPIERLRENAGDLFVHRSIFSDQSEAQIQRAARARGYDANNFGETILRAAAQNHVSPNILIGLAARESSLNPDAINRKTGAKGLFQLLPARQQDLGISDEDVLDYKVQIPKVAAALRRALDRYNGNFDLAIASWTLGDRKLQQHLNRGGPEGIRKLFLDSEHPEQGRLGPNYIDSVKSFL